MPLVVVGISVAVLLLLMTRLKLNGFAALLLVAVGVGAGPGDPGGEIPRRPLRGHRGPDRRHHAHHRAGSHGRPGHGRLRRRPAHRGQAAGRLRAARGPGGHGGHVHAHRRDHVLRGRLHHHRADRLHPRHGSPGRNCCGWGCPCRSPCPPCTASCRRTPAPPPSPRPSTRPSASTLFYGLFIAVPVGAFIALVWPRLPFVRADGPRHPQGPGQRARVRRRGDARPGLVAVRRPLPGGADRRRRRHRHGHLRRERLPARRRLHRLGADRPAADPARWRSGRSGRGSAAAWPTSAPPAARRPRRWR